jgi:beta-aspartyl-dipeptidase (metallo-type)
VDVTAFPVEEGEDAWSADEAVVRYLDAGADPSRITVSSDGGGCLPVFDDDGRVASFDVGSPSACGETLRVLLARGQPLERVLPAFTTNPARVLQLHRKGQLRPGADADLVVLDKDGAVADVMARGRWHVRDGRAVVRGVFEGG